jgi:hypothetical protein
MRRQQASETGCEVLQANLLQRLFEEENYLSSAPELCVSYILRVTVSIRGMIEFQG